MVGAGLSKPRQITWGAAVLSLLKQVRASPVGGSGAAHLYVFYLSWRLWEAHLYMFYVSGRLRGGRMSNGLKTPGGSARKDLTRAGGGSFVRILRVREAPGRDRFRRPMTPGGSAKEGPHACGGRGGGEGRMGRERSSWI